MARKLIAWLFGAAYVVLIDYNGALTFRIAYGAGARLIARRVGMGVRTVILEPDGRVSGGAYCTRWEMLKDYRRSNHA